MEAFESAKPTGVCTATGREFAEGEEYYAVLFEEGESFRRQDYSADAWEGPPESAYCFFKTRVPVRQQKKQRLLVDDDMLENFFLRLADETEPVRQHFRFVLALILMRKRLLKYEQTLNDGDAEYWQMRLVRQKSLHRVRNPRLTDDEIERVSQELTAILHGDVVDRLTDDDSDADNEPRTSTAEGGDGR